MRTGGTPAEWKVIPIAPGSDIFKSPDPENVSLSNPSIVALPGGRIVVSMDMTGPGAKHVPGTKGRDPLSGHWLLGKVFVTGDKGKTWTWKTDYPFHQAQLLRIGSALYLVGLAGDFKVMRSVDGGETWSKTASFALDEGEYVISPVNALLVRDQVYFAVMKRVTEKDGGGVWFSPVILRARQGVDLANRKAWSLSEPGSPLDELASPECLAYYGLPVPPPSVPGTPKPPEKDAKRRSSVRLSWEVPHMVAAGPNLRLLATARINRVNVAALVKVNEDVDGHMRLLPESAPDATGRALISMPGGHMKFDVVYDDASRLYWLACNPAADSTTRHDRGQGPRGGEMRDDRQELHLYFSPNLVDWRLAACVDSGVAAKELRHFCNLAIGGNDMYLVCCSGHAKHGGRGYTDRITFHSIPAFRELVY
jgi:hypothetical protein